MSGAVPELRFPGFEGEWEETTLGAYMTFKNGVNADKDAYGRGRKFVNVMDIIRSEPITHDSIIGSVDISDAEFAKNEVKFGDILFQRSSETREEVGQSNVYLDENRSASFGGFVIRGRAVRSFNPRFFDALLRTDSVRKDMTSRSGGSTRYNIGQESLEKVSITAPHDEAEQEKIAEFLDATSRKITLLTDKKTALEDYKRGLMQRLFSRELRFPRDDGSAFPDWEEQKLGQLIEVFYGKDHKHLPEGDIPVLGSGGVMRHVDEALAHGPAIVIGRKGTINRPWFVEGPFWTVDTLFYTKVRGKNDPRFVFAVMQTINWLRYNEATGVPSLSASAIKKVPVSLPTDPDEQHKIAAALSTLDAKIDALSHKISEMEAFKNGLLQKLFV